MNRLKKLLRKTESHLGSSDYSLLPIINEIITMQKLKVESVNISEKKGNVKVPVDRLSINHHGVEGDAHAGTWNRQISILGTESYEKFQAETGRKFKYGDFAENITTSGYDLTKVSPLDHFKYGNLILEITQIGKKCHGSTCAIFNEVGNCIMPKEGIFCRVIESGHLKKGDTLTYYPRIYKAAVITLSDRAYDGTYQDRTGPRINELIKAFFEVKNKILEIDNVIIPDDELMLKRELNEALSAGADMIFTSGGTGVGPRDITPDVVRSLLDKEIPGIMEQIRVKYGNEKPSVLISRSVAGVIGQSVVFTIPGSVNAADDYLKEILKNLEHLIYMIHGLDLH